MVITARLCEYAKNHWIIHFIWMNCVAYELYLNEAVTEKGGWVV